MKASRLRESVYWIGLILSAWAGAVSGQTFSSGSTGADGAFSPTANTVVPLPADGVLNYTTVTIPAGVTVTFQRNAANTPVTLLTTGDVTISGTINVGGSQGGNENTSSNIAAAGGLGGPGGFRGGNGGVAGGASPTHGQGPGGGAPNGATAAEYGAPSAFVTLFPLFGGSGGGGANPPGSGTGVAGGGGAGAIVIASSSKIVISGSVVANGGASGNRGSGSCSSPGSGGAIRLVAPQISGGGSVQANAGANGQNNCGTANAGRIRVEAFTLGFTGTYSPAASQSVVPGPVAAASNPALVNLPTLAVTSVDGVAAPALPAGSYTAADVSLPQGTSNPVAVTIAATNTPVPASITLRLMPQTAGATTINVAAGNHTGTFASSSATANVTFPAGQVSLIQAWASMTLTGQIASLMPLIDGEPVERVTVASLDGGSSALNLVTRSGKEKRFDELAPLEQLKVAQAWQMMRDAR